MEGIYVEIPSLSCIEYGCSGDKAKDSMLARALAVFLYHIINLSLTSLAVETNHITNGNASEVLSKSRHESFLLAFDAERVTRRVLSSFKDVCCFSGVFGSFVASLVSLSECVLSISSASVKL